MSSASEFNVQNDELAVVLRIEDVANDDHVEER
jgi:hypothetical protein